MAVYKGDTEDEVNATNAYNQALQTLAESSVPLSAGGDYAATIRKNWPVGQMQFARGGYAGKGFVKPLAGAAEEAIATAKRLMTREPVPVRAPDPYVKGVNDRKPELQQAIKDLYEGKITREQYDDVVRQVLPVEPYDFIPQPSPEGLAVDALNAAKKDKYGMNRDIYQEGDPVSLRLDIPAYTNLPNSQWVNSIHDTQGIHPTTYDSVSAARNVDFVVPENKARMTGEGGPKAPYAVMRGEYVPITAEEAVAQAQEIMGGPLPSQWQQVGMDPRRHSYFYTRDERMMPVTNADEVLQIGPVVYAKNPKIGEREDFGYARGGYAEGGDPEIEDALRLAQEGSNPMEFAPNTNGPQQSPFDLRDSLKSAYESTMAGAGKRHEDWLLSHGYSPEIAKQQGQKVQNLPSDIAHTADEWLVPHSATDVALMAIPGGGPVRKAVGAGAIALDQMINPAEAGQGKLLQKASGIGEDIYKGLGKLFAPGSGYVPVPGKPATVKIPTIGEVEARPVPEIQSAAEKYMRSIGREGEHEVRSFPEFDVERARRIAQAYEDMQHDPTNPAVKRSYDALVDETMAQYRALKDAGYDFRFNANDPYALSPSMGYADVVNNGRLTVFPTETGGFGSSIHDQSSIQPLLVGVGRVGDLPNATANDAFRAVHDMFGHYGSGNPFFRDKGEERAWLLHQYMYSPDARSAMTNETRGQNSWVNHGPYGERNRAASGADTVYAEQKTGLMPEWTMDVPEGYARGGYPEKGEGYDPQAEAEALRVARETNPREEHAMFTGALRSKLPQVVTDALRLAEQMMKEGIGKREILKETGWFHDPQGMPKDYRGATNIPQWKTEINDLNARLKMSPEEFAGSSFHHLGDVLEHPELFDVMPSMKTLSVGQGKIRGPYRGYFDPKEQYIGMRSGMDPDLFLSTLLHEGQHGLQNKNFFVPGGDPARMTQFTDNTMEALNRELALKVAQELKLREWEPWGSKIDALRPSLIGSDPRFAEKSGWGRFIDDAYKADPVEHAEQTEAIRARNFGSDTAVDAYKRIHGENEAYNVENRLKQGITKDQMRDIHPEDTALHPFDQTFQQSPQ